MLHHALDFYASATKLTQKTCIHNEVSSVWPCRMTIHRKHVYACGTKLTHKTCIHNEVSSVWTMYCHVV